MTKTNFSISLSKPAKLTLQDICKKTGQKQSSIMDDLLLQSSTRKYIALKIVSLEEEADAYRSLLNKLITMDKASEELERAEQ